MKIEVWSDIVCPFCYIGKRRLEEALRQFSSADGPPQIVYRSFQLDPSAVKKRDQTVHEKLASKYGVSIDQAKAMHNQMAEQAKQVGLHYQFDTMIPANTEDAHRLSHFAKENGKMEDFMERVMKAYFTESLDIDDHETLASLAAEAGLDKENALAVLSEDAYREEVQQDQEDGLQAGVKGVPCFVFNKKYALSGAQPVEAFLQVLEKADIEEKVE
ncbi:DsbA family protein [Alteribacillus sp. HJP-4]|uniref:DsbA family oxidoreductase n=1 Tax=Alteribacillus sp. HJP-4 TaxID=2775394 RepID=UPI0035CD007E